jgi:hypothetical protein
MKKSVGHVTCVAERQEMHAQFTLLNLKGKESLSTKIYLREICREDINKTEIGWDGDETFGFHRGIS